MTPTLQPGEFLRLFSHDDHIVCLIDPAALGSDPGLFGIAIVDAIRHGAKAWSKALDIPESEAMNRIMELVEAELAQATDEPQQISDRDTN